VQNITPLATPEVTAPAATVNQTSSNIATTTSTSSTSRPQITIRSGGQDATVFGLLFSAILLPVLGVWTLVSKPQAE
jgi:hypothetical protein